VGVSFEHKEVKKNSEKQIQQTKAGEREKEKKGNSQNVLDVQLGQETFPCDFVSSLNGNVDFTEDSHQQVLLRFLLELMEKRRRKSAVLYH